MRVALFEDRWERLEPLSLTRPTFDLKAGARTLREKQLDAAHALQWGAWVRPWLADVCRVEHPHRPINDLAWLRSQPVLLINGRWLPSGPIEIDEPCVGMIDDQVAFAWVPPEAWHGAEESDVESLLHHLPMRLPNAVASGQMIDRPWDLVEANARELECDFCVVRSSPRRSLQDVTVLGSADYVWIDPTAAIEPMVLIDARNGPVVIGSNAQVAAFSRIEGPCHVGASTQILGAKLRGGVSLGPHCKIGGELEAAIVHGFSNKSHDGFLGHSYVGEWVNLGAGTHSSDLRNDYGEIGVVQQGRLERTGLRKVGCFVGDHVKMGLGTLLNTGSAIGAFSQVLPAGRFAPKYMPPFSTYVNGTLREAPPVSALLETARIAMNRRGRTLTLEQEALYRAIEMHTAAERTRAIRENEQRTLRRQAG
jgi:UDP-N-acetylglucosamine diphosphorylase/glucosamine-1-phosphate N-acetyltransferase